MSEEKEPDTTPLVRGDVEQAFPLVEIVRESWAWTAQHEPNNILFYATIEGREPDCGPKSALRAKDMIELLDAGSPLVREYLELLTSVAIRTLYLRRKFDPPKTELKFRKVGKDVNGREVLEVDGFTDLYGAAENITAYCKRLQITRSLLWNGIATLCFPGMTKEEWLLENEIRRTAYQSGRWPQQLMPFSLEIDPFKITRVSEPDPL